MRRDFGPLTAKRTKGKRNVAFNRARIPQQILQKAKNNKIFVLSGDVWRHWSAFENRIN